MPDISEWIAAPRKKFMTTSVVFLPGFEIVGKPMANDLMPWANRSTPHH
jgi:hypothetical protein